MVPIWVYALIAAAIAGFAFCIGQFAPGNGVPFVILTSTMWVAYSVQRQRNSAIAGG